MSSSVKYCQGLGALPDGWKLRRIKDAGNLVLGKMLQDRPFEGGKLKPYLKSRNVKWLVPQVDSVDEMYFTDKELTELRLKVGDLVFTEGGEVGKTAYWNGEVSECYIQNSVQKLTCNKSFLSRFVMYVSFELGNSGFYESIVNHVSIMHLTREKLSRVQLPFPSLETQHRIVAYLDEKTEAIDARVAVLEKKLDAYKRLKASIINRAVTRGLDPNAKLKDSGVDWIGQVPEGWKVQNLANMVSFFKGLQITKEDLVDEGVAVVSYGQIHSRQNNGVHLDHQLLRFVPNETAYLDMSKKLKFGDVVFADTSEDVEGCGNCVLVDTDEEVFAGYHDIVVRPSCSEQGRFFAYLFNSESWRSQIRSRVVGIKVFSITQKIFKGVSVLCPPLAEQHAITDYLDVECAKIDKASAIVAKQIDAYKRLKRSLINEVVTGKRKVA